MDHIWNIIERAIATTDIVDQRDPPQKEIALHYLRRLADELRVSSPSHAALIRLERYIEEYTR